MATRRKRFLAETQLDEEYIAARTFHILCDVQLQTRTHELHALSRSMASQYRTMHILATGSQIRHVHASNSLLIWETKVDLRVVSNYIDSLHIPC